MKLAFKNKLKKIKLLALDFDGVLTDGMVYVDQAGGEVVRCSRKDGLGIDMLKRAGIEVCVISKETNPVVSARCKKLDVRCWQSVNDGEGKAEILKRIAEDRNIPLKEIAYMGDDLNDIGPLTISGAAFTVADGHASVKKICGYVTSRKGGDHAVREVCELILTAKGKELRF